MTRTQMERRIIEALPTLSTRGLQLIVQMLMLFPGLRAPSPGEPLRLRLDDDQGGA